MTPAQKPAGSVSPPLSGSQANPFGRCPCSVAAATSAPRESTTLAVSRRCPDPSPAGSVVTVVAVGSNTLRVVEALAGQFACK